MLKLVCMTALVSGSMADQFWRSVDVDRSYLVRQLSTVTSEAPSLRLCGTMCDKDPSCLSWYYENQVCSLTDLMVSPLHKAKTSDTVKFFTSIKHDFSVGSTVTASSIPWFTAFATNLANGIYNKKVASTCFRTDGSINTSPWILFKFQSAQMIHKISITAKSTSFDEERNPNGAEIRVGSRVPETVGDFSSYKLFGKLPETVGNGETCTVENTDGMTGRFVSIQKISSSMELVVCYVLIT